MFIYDIIILGRDCFFPSCSIEGLMCCIEVWKQVIQALRFGILVSGILFTHDKSVIGVSLLSLKDKHKKTKNSLPKRVKMKVTYTRPLFSIHGKKPQVIIINAKKLGIVVTCLTTAVIVGFLIHSSEVRNSAVDNSRAFVESHSPDDVSTIIPYSEKEEGQVDKEEVKKTEVAEEPQIIDLSGNDVEVKSSVKRINEPTPFGREIIYSGGNAPNIDEPVFQQLFMHNMDTGEENVVAKTQIKFGEIYEGRFNKDWVVWLDTNQSGTNDLYALNRKLNEVIKIKTCNFNKPKLQLWGDNLVWVEQIDANQDRLYLYNFKSGEPVSLESFDNPTYGTCPPAISNDVLVWTYPYEDGNQNSSIIKKLDLSKALFVPAGENNSADARQAGAEQQEIQQQGDEQQQAQQQENQQEEPQPSNGATHEEGVDPQIIDPRGFAIYPATNGKIIAWLDNLDPSQANLKMTADDGKTIITIAKGVARPFGVGDNFVAYMQDDSIMVYFWETETYARLTAPGEKGRLSASGIQGNTVVWYDANDNNRKEDIVRISIVEQPSKAN